MGERVISKGEHERLDYRSVAHLQRTAGNTALNKLLRTPAPTTVQRYVPDYQNQMAKGSTVLTVDTRGNDVASATTLASAPTSDRVGVPGMGMLELASIPEQHAFDRQAWFRAQMERTLTASITGYYGDKSDTFAYRSQAEALEHYVRDADLIPQAEQAFNFFVPLANMATRAMVKADTVATELGFGVDSDVAMELSEKEQESLQNAVAGQQLKDLGSVELHANDVMSERKKLVASSLEMAAVIKGEVIATLRKDVSAAQGDRKAIEEKIEKAAELAKIVQTGASMVAGGAGAIVTATTLPEVSEGGPLEGGKSVASGVSERAGLVADAITFGVKLYYQEELVKLTARIKSSEDFIKSVSSVQAWNQVDAKRKEFEGQAGTYKTAVEKYEAAIRDRRSEMAAIGKAADKALDKGGREQNVSQTVLFASVVLEARSMIDTAIVAGTEAKEKLGETYAQMSSHRSPYAEFYYQLAEDVFTTKRRSDGMDGPDVKVVFRLKWLTTNWVEGALQAKTVLDGLVGGKGPSGEGGISGLLRGAGFSGRY